MIQLAAADNNRPLRNGAYVSDTPSIVSSERLGISLTGVGQHRLGNDRAEVENVVLGVLQLTDGLSRVEFPDMALTIEDADPRHVCIFPTGEEKAG